MPHVQPGQHAAIIKNVLEFLEKQKALKAAVPKEEKKEEKKEAAAPKSGAKAGVKGKVSPARSGAKQDKKDSKKTRTGGQFTEKEQKEMLAKLDDNMVEQIRNSMIDSGPGVAWEDIIGLKDVKATLVESIVSPQLRPDLFEGLRAPTRGMLFYGPPGNGKTLLAKAVASQCKSTFFSVSASTLMSKWVGDSERLMKTLFGLAEVYAPSIIFFDEIDSMLGARGGGS